MDRAQDLLSDLQSDSSLFTKLELAFGNSFNSEIADDLIGDFAQNDFSKIPTIKAVDSEIINGADGVHNRLNEFIYLSQDSIDNSQSEYGKITDVLLEEIGHFVDSQINESDAVGDEGELFANLVRGTILSASDINLIKAQDDRGNITIDGKATEVEYSTSNDVEHELVDQTLSIKGTQQNDIIQIATNKQVELYVEQILVKTFERSQVDRIQILALDGNDTIDLSNVDVDTRVYGGK